MSEGRAPEPRDASERGGPAPADDAAPRATTGSAKTGAGATPAKPRSKPPARRRRRAWLSLLGVGVVLAVALRLGGVWASRKIIFPVSRTPLSAPRSSARPPLTEVVSYVTEDGVELRGALTRSSDSAEKPTIVFFHGNGESAAGEVDFGAMLALDLHVDVFVAEYRGYGGARGEPTEDNLYADGRAAVKATGRAPGDVIVSGWSLGTAVAVELAHEGVGRAVVLFAPFTSIPDVATHLAADPRLEPLLAEQLGDYAFLAGPIVTVAKSPIKSWLIADTFDSDSKIRDLTIPVVVVHGDEDDVVAFEMGEALAGHASRGSLVRVPGASHGVHRRDVAVAAFWRVLGDAGSAPVPLRDP